MLRMQPNAHVPLFAAVALAMLAACSGGSNAGNQASSTPEPQPAHVGSAAPDFKEPVAGGGTLELASLKGKAVYLNFFASWCPPCNEEASAVDALQRKYGPRGLQVVGVDVLENETKAAQFHDSHHLHYPALVDSGALRDAYNINGLPVHVFIDRRGIVSNIVVGELQPDEMDENVQRIIH